MNALVLACEPRPGRGKVNERTCLLHARGRTLLERVLTALQYAGVRVAHCLVDPGAEDVGVACHRFGPNLIARCFERPRFGERGISAYRAIDECLEGPCVIVDANQLFPVPLLRRVCEAPGDDIVVVDPRVASLSHPRVVPERGVVSRLVVPGEPARSAAAMLGCAKLGQRSAEAIRHRLRTVFFPRSCHELLLMGDLEQSALAMEIVDEPWQRIASRMDHAEIPRVALEIVRWELAYARRG